MNRERPEEGSEADRRAAADRAEKRAEELRREGRHEEGIDLLLETLPLGCRKGQLYYRLGNLYYDKGDPHRAEYAYRQAITNDPAHINAHHNLGVVYRRQNRVSESLKMRKRAQQLARRHPDRIAVTPTQARQARRFAVRWVAVGLAVLGGLVLLGVLAAGLWS